MEGKRGVGGRSGAGRLFVGKCVIWCIASLVWGGLCIFPSFGLLWELGWYGGGGGGGEVWVGLCWV